MIGAGNPKTVVSTAMRKVLNTARKKASGSRNNRSKCLSSGVAHGLPRMPSFTSKDLKARVMPYSGK